MTAADGHDDVSRYFSEGVIAFLACSFFSGVKNGKRVAGCCLIVRLPNPFKANLLQSLDPIS